MKYVALTLAILMTPAVAQDATWHLLTQTQGGTISLLHGLDKKTCEFAKNRALGLPATPEEIAAAAEQGRITSERNSAICPPDGTTRAGWEDWYDKHPLAGGCTNADGRGMSSWSASSLHMILPGDIKSAECFQ